MQNAVRTKRGVAALFGALGVGAVVAVAVLAEASEAGAPHPGAAAASGAARAEVRGPRPTQPGGDPSRSPLRGLTPPSAEDLDHGEVVERLEAGPYTYLRIVDRAEGHEAWLATLGAGAPLGADIEVRSFGTRTDYASKRLGRTFARLTFAWITDERRNGEER